MPSRFPSTYAERLAYARWVQQLTTKTRDESDQDLIRRSGVKQSWFSKWRDSETPPPRHLELKPLSVALGVTMDFLLGDGDPPFPALWEDWLRARRGHPLDATESRYRLAPQPDSSRDYRYTDEEISADRAARAAEAARKTPAQRKTGNSRPKRG